MTNDTGALMRHLLARWHQWRPRRAAGGQIVARPQSSDSVTVRLSDGMFVPSGHDPYGRHLADDECVLSTRTGRCIRDHRPKHGTHGYMDVREEWKP